MIIAEFTGNNPKTGFSVKGHAGYAKSGKDIVCAAVTSAVQLTANGITEILKTDAEVIVNEDEIKLSLPQNSPKAAYDFVEALYLHLSILSGNYRKNVKVIVTEV